MYVIVPAVKMLPFTCAVFALIYLNMAKWVFCVLQTSNLPTLNFSMEKRFWQPMLPDSNWNCSEKFYAFMSIHVL